MVVTHIDVPAHFGDLTEKSTDAQIRACPEVREEYGRLLDHYPDHPVHIDGRGTGRSLRWKANSVVQIMGHRENGIGVDLNKLWVFFIDAKLPIEDMATVYRMMGYSLCGFLEVFGDSIEGIL